MRSGYNQWEYAGFVEQLNWNYRRDKLDVFGTVYYRKVKGLTKVGLLKMCMLIRFGIRTIISRKTNQQAFTNIAGVNYAFDENNSIGVKYTLKANPDARYHTIFNSDVYTTARIMTIWRMISMPLRIIIPRIR